MGAPIVIGADSVEGKPTPRAFFAATRNVYEDPFVNPVTTTVVALGGERVRRLRGPAHVTRDDVGGDRGAVVARGSGPGDRRAAVSRRGTRPLSVAWACRP